MWRQQHVVGHHAYTNLDKIDPDIRTTDTDVRSVTPHHGWHPYHVRLPSAKDADWHSAAGHRTRRTDRSVHGCTPDTAYFLLS